MSIPNPYGEEATAPSDGTLHEILRYTWDENARRWFNSTNNLTQEDFSHDPGEGSWSIGEIFKHMLMLQTMIIENLEPGASKSVERPDIGEPGAWNLEAMFTYRESLNERFRELWVKATPETLMDRRPDMRPDHWAEWPVAMRMMRPFIDISTHIGQINYARRQLGKPVGRA